MTPEERVQTDKTYSAGVLTACLFGAALLLFVWFYVIPFLEYVGRAIAAALD